MLVQAKKIVVLSLIALAITVISLPAVSLSATSPVVSVLSPIVNGLRSPVKIALDADGNIYVADQRVGGVVKFDKYGVPQMTIRTAAAPNGLAFDLGGNLLVSQGTLVARYDVKTGLETGRLEDGHLQLPSGIAVDDGTGYIYVADSLANQIVMYTAIGGYAGAFGTGVRATADGASVLNPPGKLSMPTGIFFEKVAKHIVVADTLSSRVQFFDQNGKFVKSIGNPVSVVSSGTATVAPASSTGAMQFLLPTAVAFEYSKTSPPVLNRIYVVDSYMANLQVIDPGTSTIPASKIAVPSGAATNYIGSSGIANGQLMAPNDAVFDGVNNRLFVVNGFGNITVYGIDGGKYPTYVAVPPPVVVVPPAPPAPPVLDIATIPYVTRFSVASISGTVEAGAAVNVANKVGEVVVTGTAWSCDVALVEGVNTLTVTATKLGVSTTKSVAVTLDTVAPLLNVSALSTGSYTSTSVVNISGSATDLNGATVSINGVPATLTDNKFWVAFNLLNGVNQVVIEAVDVVGNKTVDSRTLNFDATVPVIAIIAPVDNSYTANSELKISGTIDKTSVITVQGLPATLDANNWSASINLDPGVNTIEIVAVDLYGNSSSVKRSITLDTVKPALAVSSPAQDIAVKVPNITIEGTVSDVSALSLKYTVNGSTGVVPVIAGAFSFNVDFTAEGNYPVTLTAEDAVGNASTVVRTVIYDVTPPTFTLDQVVGVMPERLSGSVEAGSSIIVKAIINTEVPEAFGTVVIADGLWTADLAGVIYIPETLLAVATDAAGNSTSKTMTYVFPNGTLNEDGKPTVQDALRAIRIVVNNVSPSALELAHYDIGPLVGGKPNPNGKIGIDDAILILRKALGLKSW